MIPYLPRSCDRLCWYRDASLELAGGYLSPCTILPCVMRQSSQALVSLRYRSCGSLIAVVLEAGESRSKGGRVQVCGRAENRELQWRQQLKLERHKWHLQAALAADLCQPQTLRYLPTTSHMVVPITSIS